MARIALSINDSDVCVFDPLHIEEARRLGSNRCMLIFPDSASIEIAIPQDILFVCLRGRKELPGWQTFSGFRVRAYSEGGPIWRIAIHPFEDSKLLVEAMFRSKDFAIFLPPNAAFMPTRLGIIK